MKVQALLKRIFAVETSILRAMFLIDPIIAYRVKYKNRSCL